MGTHAFAAQHGAALRGQRLGQRGRDDEIGLAGQAGLVHQPAAAGTAYPEPVRLVDDEHRAVGAGDPVQVGQRREIAVGAEHRVGEYQRAFLGARGEHPVHRGHVAVRGDLDARAGQAAGIHQRGV
ncbi:Uncharacterised protein [Mycobacteroides abscessus subsp. abscessus]|nr:Uncharacterised protein [Mycobacteroides abscessus subsp. abscessus]